MFSSQKPQSADRSRKADRDQAFRLICAYTALIAVVLLFGNLFVLTWRPSLSETFQRDVPKCPVFVKSGQSDEIYANATPMSMYAYGTYGEIRFESAVEDGSPCRITIVQAPPEAHQFADWRVGFYIPDPVRYRGKTVNATLVLRTDRAMAMPMARFYVHDGATGNSTSLPASDGLNEVSVPISHKVSSEAKSLEFWLRLVSPSGGEIDEGRIELVRFEVDPATSE